MEKALLLMWNAGVIHTDLHMNNFLVGHDHKTLALIDFGLAMRMSDTDRRAVQQVLYPFISKLRHGEYVDVRAILGIMERKFVDKYKNKGGATSNMMSLKHMYNKGGAPTNATRRAVWQLWERPKKRPRANNNNNTKIKTIA